MLLLNDVRGEAQVTSVLLQAHTLSTRDHRDREAWYARTLAKLVDAERFPALGELIAAGTFEPKDDLAGGAALFEFGLGRILDGLAPLVRRGPSP